MKQQYVTNNFFNYFLSTSVTVVICVLLYLSSLYNYLLFHYIAEIFSIIIACGLFMIAWNTRDYIENKNLVYLGIAYLFVAILDLFHTISYKGTTIFEYQYHANQLWIAARFIESVSLLVFFLLSKSTRIFSYFYVFLLYILLTVLTLLSVFYWNIFPICFIDGIGLTPFKKNSEYVICFILLASMVTLYINRDAFDTTIRKFMIWTTILTIFGELAFTFYISNYGFSNLIGHYLKIVSFYLVYKAIIETGLRDPFRIMFKQLKESEQRYKNLFNTSLVGIFRTSSDGTKILEANQRAVKIFGYDSIEEFISMFSLKKLGVDANKFEKDNIIENIEIVTKTKYNIERAINLNSVLYKEKAYIENAVIDITEQVETKKKIQQSMELEATHRGKIEMASNILHDIGNAITALGTRVTSKIGEEDWLELVAVSRLDKLVRQKQDAFDNVLGQGKSQALLNVINEIQQQLTNRKNKLKEDFLTMTKTIGHINEILNIQRLYAQEMPSGKRGKLNLVGIIEDAISIHWGSFEKRNIVIERDIKHNFIEVSGDRTRLMQVFLNVFRNICEAFDELDNTSERKMCITTILTDNKIIIVFKDNAIGFDPAISEKLFDQGFSTKQRNSGLGLYQCRNILESNNGTIRLESDGIGKGSCTYIEFNIS